jgi:hypothetical protein
VLALYGRLKEAFEQGPAPQAELMHQDGGREAKTLAGAASAGSAWPASPRRRLEKPRAN